MYLENLSMSVKDGAGGRESGIQVTYILRGCIWPVMTSMMDDP